LTSNTQTTVRAADLAERIVDEISQAGQDWPAIEREARELLELIARLAAGQAVGQAAAAGPRPDR
jgi:hypothetical protein